MSMCIEVDFCNADSVAKVLEFLKSQLPYSVLPLQLLTYVHQNVITREDIHAQLFVNNLAEIKCVVILYSTPGLVPSSNVIHNYTRNVAIVCDKQYTTHVLVEMLTKCIPWKQKHIFCAIDSRYVTPVIEKFVQQNKTGNYETSTYIQFILDRCVFLEKSKILPSVVPEGIEIRSLKPEDAPFMVEAWGYKSDDLYSVAQVRFCIEKLYTLGEFCRSCYFQILEVMKIPYLENLGAYRDGKLLCWRLLQYDGSLDMTYTIPEARRLGLSSLLSVRLTGEMFKRQERVFGHVAPNNRKSLGLAAKMGFYETGTSDWIQFEPSDLGVERNIHHHKLKSSI